MPKGLHVGHVVGKQIVRRHHYKGVIAREDSLQRTYIGVDVCRRIHAVPTVGASPGYLAGWRDDEHRVFAVVQLTGDRGKWHEGDRGCGTYSSRPVARDQRIGCRRRWTHYHRGSRDRSHTVVD